MKGDKLLKVVTIFVTVWTGWMIITSVAFGDTWEEYLGYRILKGPGGEVIKAWSKTQWGELERTLDGMGSDAGYASNSEWYSAVEGAGSTEYKQAGEIVEDARIEGTGAKTGLVEGIEEAGADGGTLPLDMGAGTIAGGLLLGPAAFVLGVELGNGIDSLLHFPKLEVFTGETEEKEYYDTEGPHRWRVSYYKEWRYTSTFGATELPPGYYLECGAVGSGAAYLNEYNTGYPGDHRIEECPDPPFAGSHLPFKYGGEHGSTVEWWYDSAECNAHIWTVETLYPECLVPDELPGAGQITTPIEKVNTEHGLAKKPVEKSPVTRPKEVEPIEEEKDKKIIELEPVRKRIEETGPKEEGIEIPPPEKNELGTTYKTELETLGFEDVQERELPEAYINPEVGPEDVARVEPEPGHKEKPSAEISVEVNPKDAPEPGEGSSKIGAPTLPGLKLPKLALLCTTVPFGIPCWIVKQVEAFSATSEAPVWSIGPFHTAAFTIPEAKIHLSEIEPVMEKIRPWMKLFGVIGIVVFFFTVFTGKRLGGGGNPAGDVPGPETAIPEPDEETYL